MVLAPGQILSGEGVMAAAGVVVTATVPVPVAEQPAENVTVTL